MSGERRQQRSPKRRGQRRKLEIERAGAHPEDARAMRRASVSAEKRGSAALEPDRSDRAGAAALQRDQRPRAPRVVAREHAAPRSKSSPSPENGEFEAERLAPEELADDGKIGGVAVAVDEEIAAHRLAGTNDAVQRELQVPVLGMRPSDREPPVGVDRVRPEPPGRIAAVAHLCRANPETKYRGIDAPFGERAEIELSVERLTAQPAQCLRKRLGTPAPRERDMQLRRPPIEDAAGRGDGNPREIASDMPEIEPTLAQRDRAREPFDRQAEAGQLDRSAEEPGLQVEMVAAASADRIERRPEIFG